MTLIILHMITLLCFTPFQCFPEWLCLPLEFFKLLPFTFYFQVPLVVKNPPDNAGDARGAVSIPRLGRSPGEGHATHPSIHTLEILWTEKHGGLQSMGRKESDTTEVTSHAHSILVFVQFSSVTQSCPALCDPMDCSTLGLPVHHQLPEFTQTHVHWVGDAIQSSNPLSSPSPPAFNFSQHQGLFQWVSSSHQVAKVLEIQLQHQSFQRTFRTDFF